MNIRIISKGITTACDDVDFMLKDVNEDFIKSLPSFQYFIGTPYEKHLKKGLWRASLHDNNDWERVVIYLYKSKTEMENCKKYIL
jgi:hypothetical protein